MCMAIKGMEGALCGDRIVLSLCHCIFTVVVVTQIYTCDKLTSNSTHMLSNVSFHFWWKLVYNHVRCSYRGDTRWRVHVTSLYYFCNFLWIYNYFRTSKLKIRPCFHCSRNFPRTVEARSCRVGGLDTAADLYAVTARSQPPSSFGIRGGTATCRARGRRNGSFLNHRARGSFVVALLLY